MISVVCAKWGDMYSSEDVNRLFRGVSRNLTRSFRFFCLTERPEGLDDGVNWLPMTPFPFEDALTEAQAKARKKDGAFRKVAMFNPGLLPTATGTVLAMDLDVVIVGALEELIDYAPGKVCAAPPFNPRAAIRTKGEGSIIKFETNRHQFLYHDLAEEPAAMVSRYQGSEQSYTTGQADEKGVLANFPSEWVVSFKRHCRPARPLNLFLPPALPVGARVVCFHGRPNVAEAVEGYSSDILHRTRKAAWIANNWR